MQLDSGYILKSIIEIIVHGSNVEYGKKMREVNITPRFGDLENGRSRTEI